jgi:23S rRNA pseudouridine2605 synthase
MPPRHAYWTILIDDQPTAFRAHDPEELLPTLNRLREKNETAVMKWFERGQLFDSRDAARDAGLGKGERRWEGPRPERRDGGSPVAKPRDKNWRPGGEHRDPRQPYKDARKAKWSRFKEKIRERHEQRLARDPEQFSPPHGDPLRDELSAKPPRREERTDRRQPGDWHDRNERQGRPDRPDQGGGRGFTDRRHQERQEQRFRPAPSGERRPDYRGRDGAPSRPHGDTYREQRPKPPFRPRTEDRGEEHRGRDARGEPRDTRGDWRDRPPRRDGDRRDDSRGGWRPKGAAKFAKKPSGAKKSFGAKKPFKPSGTPKRFGAGKRSDDRPFGSRRRRDDDE